MTFNFGEYKDWSTHGTWYSPRIPRWISCSMGWSILTSVNIMFHGLINPCIHFIESHQLYTIYLHRPLQNAFHSFWVQTTMYMTLRTILRQWWTILYISLNMKSSKICWHKTCIFCILNLCEPILLLRIDRILS
jgi:hypothetical protein